MNLKEKKAKVQEAHSELERFLNRWQEKYGLSSLEGIRLISAACNDRIQANSKYQTVKYSLVAAARDLLLESAKIYPKIQRIYLDANGTDFLLVGKEPSVDMCELASEISVELQRANGHSYPIYGGYDHKLPPPTSSFALIFDRSVCA